MTQVHPFAALSVVLLLVGGGTASATETEPAAPVVMAPDVKGGIAWFRGKNYDAVESVWSDTRLAAGRTGGPASTSFERQPDGTWKTGVTVLTVKGSRITGGNIDLTLKQLPDGFHLTGLYFKNNVDLLVTSKKARARQIAYVRNEKGAYVSENDPLRYVRLEGEAADLKNPKFPEIALAAVAAGWGVDRSVGAPAPVPARQDAPRDAMIQRAP